jgi:hypothetical protein
LTSDQSKQPVVYRSVDAADKFVEYMVIEQEEIEQKFKHCEPMIMTGSDWQSFKKVTHGDICSKELNQDRVRDHCHVIGKFIGASHNDCNINYKFTGRIPVIFHNLRGYDSHLIMQAIGKSQQTDKMYTKQHGKVYIVFAWMHGFYRFLPIYVIIVGKTNRKSCKGRTKNV